MPATSLTTRLAYAALGAGLLAVLTPGIHFGLNLEAPRGQIAVEAAGLGAAVAAVAILLAIVALRRFRREHVRTGEGCARAALGLGGIGLALGLGLLLMAVRG